MGLEPTTFCMASRRSSQLSYIRAGVSIAAVRGATRRLSYGAASSASLTSRSASVFCSRLTPVAHLADGSREPPRAEGEIAQGLVLDLVFPAHLLDHQLGVRDHLDLVQAQPPACSSPAMRARYSATLFVAIPIASPCAASTVPSSASRT